MLPHNLLSSGGGIYRSQVPAMEWRGRGGGNGTSDLLELELTDTVRLPTQVLRKKLGPLQDQ